ncbi:MAG: hypothetical protein KDA87_13485 [Planctomycetales bacterium]|nr:hypothetical protein [Planctomycetales bacterium]
MDAEPIALPANLDRSLWQNCSASVQRSLENLCQQFVQMGVPGDLLNTFLPRFLSSTDGHALDEHLVRSVQDYVCAHRSPLSFLSLVERDELCLPVLLNILKLGSAERETLFADPEAFELIRVTDGQPLAEEDFFRDVHAEITSMPDRTSAIHDMCRHYLRERLRILYGHIYGKVDIDQTLRQITVLANAICESALTVAERKLQEKRGIPCRPDGTQSAFTVIAVGELAGWEATFQTAWELFFLYDADGRTNGAKPIDNADYFEQLTREVLEILHELGTKVGQLPFVQVFRTSGDRLAIQRHAALRHFDTRGRTWERDAWVKARRVAGDQELAAEFLALMETWVYRRYYTPSDLTGVRALKRRLQQHLRQSDLHAGKIDQRPGGLDDIHGVVRLLQLINGGDVSEVRTTNSRDAIRQLGHAQFLTQNEQAGLESALHAFQRMQISLADPSQPDVKSMLDQSQATLQQILNDTFPNEAESTAIQDLILGPKPDGNVIQAALASFRFQDHHQAYKNVMALADERIAFLSSRRCRHYLSGIVAPLLTLISQTPNPDETLTNLTHVSESLGGKCVLWELFQFNAPTMELYVRLCSTSPYLSSMLVSNPGMLDELMDSLVLNKLPPLEKLKSIVADLVRNAENPDLILHEFKNAQHLTAGVRDILEKEDISRTMRFLSDVAEACVMQVASLEFNHLKQRYGTPWHNDQPSQFALFAFGKFGAQEPNYHSVMDIGLFYDGNGSTVHAHGKNGKSTTNQHFYNELVQRIAKRFNNLGAAGRLFEMDPLHSPLMSTGVLARPVQDLEQLGSAACGGLEGLQKMCSIRPVFGSPEIGQRALDQVREAVNAWSWDTISINDVIERRLQLQQNALDRNLKRSEGGTVDVEYLVRTLQMRHIRNHPQVFQASIIRTLEELANANLLSDCDAANLRHSYLRLRRIESGLRLMNTQARHDLPSNARDFRKLAYLLRSESADALLIECRQWMAKNREMFLRLMAL